MRFELLWLAVPVLAAPFAPARNGRFAVAQLLMSGFVLAALWQGAATLDPRELSMIAQQSSGDAWFVGASLGVLIVGGCAIPAFDAPWRGLLALPMVAAAAIAMHRDMALAVIVGGAVALLPLALARVIGRPAAQPAKAPVDGSRSAIGRDALIATAAVILMLVAPMIVSTIGLVVLAWWCALRAGPRWQLTMVAPATALLGMWVVIALTIAGSLWVTLPAFGSTAPISPAAAQLLACLALGALMLLAWFRVLTRQRPAMVINVPLVVWACLAAARATPDGVTHWQPIISVLMLLCGGVGAFRGRWDVTAASVLVLTASRSGTPALVAALLVAAAPAVSRWPGLRVQHLAAGVVLALAVAVVLRDQVLVGTVLTLTFVTAAYRGDARVATAGDPLHL